MLGWSGCMRLCLMPTQTDRMSDLELPYPDKADCCLEQHWTMSLDEVSSSKSEALRSYRNPQPKPTTYNKMFLSPTSNYESFTGHSQILSLLPTIRSHCPVTLRSAPLHPFLFSPKWYLKCRNHRPTYPGPFNFHVSGDLSPVNSYSLIVIEIRTVS